MAAGEMAMKDSGLDMAKEDAERVGATDLGEVTELFRTLEFRALLKRVDELEEAAKAKIPLVVLERN